MKSLNWALALLLTGWTAMAMGQCGIFISEYGEGGGNNKWVEIYNPFPYAVDITGYKLEYYSSNSASVTGSYTLTGTIAAGDVFVVANNNAGNSPDLISQADATTGGLQFNGDDGLVLVDAAGVDLDVFGSLNNADPGTGFLFAGVANNTVDKTIVRKSHITSGTMDWALSAGTNADDCQWTVYAQNTFTYVGNHTFTGVCGATVSGCTNENASNYNPAANVDDGSCTFANACNADGVVLTALNTNAFSPSALAIDPGATVVFVNADGTHNVNGDINTLTGTSFGNPVAFGFPSVTGTDVCIGTFTFSVPGVYHFDSSEGSDAANGMVGTITVGVGGCTNPAAPNYNQAADFDDGSCLAVPTTPIATIQQGQLTGAYTGSVLMTTGVVTGVFGNLATIQDGSGPYSGIWIFGSNIPLTVGDAVQVTGTVTEYFNLTELINPSVVITAQGSALPAPQVLATSAVADEQWEGVLVRVTGDVTQAALGNNEWALSDGTGNIRVDDRGYNTILTGGVVLGNTWQITGPLDFTFSNFKIQPRNAGDALLYGCTLAGALNYNAQAQINDGSCQFSGLDCSLFFSEYGEGSSNNRYLEIYNPTGSTQFLGLYTLANCSNGCDDPTAPYITDQFDFWTFTFPANASIAPGETFIISHPSADPAILALSDMTYTFLSTGNDAYGLFRVVAGDTTLLDIIGSIGLDPGTAVGWEVAGEVAATIDNTLVRKSTVVQGNEGNWAASAGTNTFDSEWIVLPSNDWTSLGIHTADASCVATLEGCTDPFALNYDENAETENGTCVYLPSYTIQEIYSLAPTGQLQTGGIVTGVYGPTGGLNNSASFVIQDGTGAFSAIWVIGSGVAVGDEVTLTGVALDVFGLKQIQSPVITIQSSGNALPAAEVLSTGAINDPQWKSVRVQVVGDLTGTQQNFGEWSLNDNSGVGRGINLAFNPFTATVTVGANSGPLLATGAKYRMVGPNFFSFNTYKLAPMTDADFVRIGCTDPSFGNYDPLATEDDGTCVTITGCTNPIADNYNPEATVSDDSCIISGCTEPTALNYNAAANNPTNETCYYTLPNLVINEIHYNPCSSQGDDFDYEFVEIYNAEDQEANLGGFKFFNTQSGTPELALTFPAGTTMSPNSYLVLAVTANAAAYYSGLGATVLQWTVGNLSNSGEALSLQDGFGNIIDEVTYGTSSPWPSQSVTVLGNTLIYGANGGCASLELVATDMNNTSAGSWQGSWVANGTPGAQNSSAFGCTDPTACNYSATAYFSTNTCTYACHGCTYPLAVNFNPAATYDNGSCTFDFTDDCPGDLNDDGQVTAVDLLSFLAAFGTVCPQ